MKNYVITNLTMETLSLNSSFYDSRSDVIMNSNSTIDYCNLSTDSYLNISCDTILNYSLPLYGYFTPILLLITITANSLIVVVLSRRNMTSPTNMVLMGEYTFVCHSII